MRRCGPGSIVLLRRLQRGLPEIHRTPVDVDRLQRRVLFAHVEALGHDTRARLELLVQLRNQLLGLEARQRTLTAARLDLTGDALAAAALESDSLVFELATLQSLIAATSTYLDQAQQDLERVREEAVAITNSDRADHEERLAEALSRAHAALAAAIPAVMLTVREVASILGTTTQTVNSWIRNGFPRGRCPIWDVGAWKTGAMGARSIDLRAIDQAALSPIQRQRLLIAQLRLQNQVADAA